MVVTSFSVGERDRRDARRRQPRRRVRYNTRRDRLPHPNLVPGEPELGNVPEQGHVPLEVETPIDAVDLYRNHRPASFPARMPPPEPGPEPKPAESPGSRPTTWTARVSHECRCGGPSAAPAAACPSLADKTRRSRHRGSRSAAVSPGRAGDDEVELSSNPAAWNSGAAGPSARRRCSRSWRRRLRTHGTAPRHRRLTRTATLARGPLPPSVTAPGTPARAGTSQVTGRSDGRRSRTRRRSTQSIQSGPTNGSRCSHSEPIRMSPFVNRRRLIGGDARERRLCAGSQPIPNTASVG